MDKRTILMLIIVLGLFSVSCEKRFDRPNIVVILCDDLGYGDLRSFGHPIIETPNLDSMGEEGIKLTNFYSAAPVCSPSRVGLLTGRNPNRAGIYDWIPPAKVSPDKRHLVHMQSHEVTIPSLLKSAGYDTCLSGKWHCNSEFNNDLQPQPDDFGFDHWFSTQNNASPTHENPNNFVRNGQEVGPLEGFSCQILVNEALNWLENRVKKNPFYLQITFHEPHEPVASPAHLVEKYMAKAKNKNEAEYFANIENIDIAVGKLVAYLKEKHGENTLVVFSSDNGPETLNRHPKAFRSYGTTGGLKGMKLWTTEAGIRVPGFMYWIGQDTFKGTSDAITSSLDYLPTFCELSGVAIPNHTLDGQSMVPLLKAGEMERKKPLLWCFYHALNEPMVAMRKGEWKMLARLKNDTVYLPRFQNVYDGNAKIVQEAELTDFELYNLNNDLSEKYEVSENNSLLYKQLKEELTLEYNELVKNSHVWKRSDKNQ